MNNMKDLITLWYDFLMIESQNNDNTIRINKDDNPLLYKWDSLVSAISVKESNMQLTEQQKEILTIYYE